MLSTVEWALKYLEMGIDIIPNPRKPLTVEYILENKTDDYTALTLTPKLIERWFAEDKNNIAIRLGPKSGNLMAITVEDIQLFDKYVPHNTTQFFDTFTTQFKNIRTYYHRVEEPIDKNLLGTHILNNLKIKVYVNGVILAPPSVIDDTRIEALTELKIGTLKKGNELIKWLKNIDNMVEILNLLKNHNITSESVNALEELCNIAGWDSDRTEMLINMVEQEFNVKKIPVQNILHKIDYISVLGTELAKTLQTPFGIAHNIVISTEPVCFEWAPKHNICYDVKYQTFFETVKKYNKKEDEYYDLRTDLIYAGMVFEEVVIEDGIPKIKATFNDIEYVAEIEEWLRILSNSLRSTRDDNKKIRMFLQKYIEHNITTAVEYHIDPIWVNDKQIHVSVDLNIDIREVLKKLRDLYDVTTNQHAFITVLGWSLFAPLSYSFRSAGRPVPFIISSGRSGGKTELLALFIAKGYGQNRKSAVLGENSIMTEFTSMKTLGDSILPVLFDDVSLKYIEDNAEWIKSIYLHSEAGKRGKSDQSVITYFNKRNIAFTINEEVVVETAEQERFIIEYYGEEHKRREKSWIYYTLADQLPDRFMLTLFNQVFGNKKIDELINEMWYKLEERESFNWKIIEYCITKINDLCKQYNILPFPVSGPQQVVKYDWADIIFQKLYNDWKILTAIAEETSSRVARPLITEFDMDVSETIDRIRIDLTVSGYEKVKRDLKSCPYNTLTDLLNNPDPSNKFLELKWSTHRFNGKLTRTMAFIKNIKLESDFLEKIEQNEKKLEKELQSQTKNLTEFDDTEPPENI